MENSYTEVMENIADMLESFYSENSFPSGNNKSTQFENCVVEIAKVAFCEFDKGRGAPNGSHKVKFMGGKIFPDIVIEEGETGRTFGVEVKYHDSGDDWKTKGNSTYATTQVEGLEEIYLVFGKFDNNANCCRVKARPYGECISGISITHKPRYDIDMTMEEDFCAKELGVSYSTLRNLGKEQREIYVNSYIARTQYASLSAVSKEKRRMLIAQGFILFPEIFSTNPSIRYNNFSAWLFANNVICKNVRDFLTAGGRESIDGQIYPKVFYTLYDHIDTIKRCIAEVPAQVLAQAWYSSAEEVDRIQDDWSDRLRLWLELVTKHHGGKETVIGKGSTTVNFKDTLQKWLGL